MNNKMSFLSFLLVATLFLTLSAGMASAAPIVINSPANNAVVNTTSPLINITIDTTGGYVINTNSSYIALDNTPYPINSSICTSSDNVIFNCALSANNLNTGAHSIFVMLFFQNTNTSASTVFTIPATTITEADFTFNNNFLSGTDSHLVGSATFNGNLTQTGHPMISHSYNIVVQYTGIVPSNTALSDGIDNITLVQNNNDGMLYYTWTTSAVNGLRTFTLGGNPLLVNGQPVQLRVWSDADEFVDGFNNVVLTINQHNSSVSGNVDFTNEVIKYQNLDKLVQAYDIQGFSGYIDFQAGVLNPLTVDIAFKEGDSTPSYKFVNINGNKAEQIVTGYFTFKDITSSTGVPCTVSLVNSGDYSCFNNAITDVGLNTTYDTTMNFYKSGTYYNVYMDNGYGTFDNNTIKNITKIINGDIQTLNPAEFFQTVASYVNSTGVFTIANINATAVKLVNSAGNVTYDLPEGNLSVDTKQIPLISGTYTLTVTAKDSYGNNASKNMTVVLNINAQESTSSPITLNNSDVNGSQNVTFSNPTVDSIVDAIVVPNNATNESFTINAQVFGSTLPTIESVSALASENNAMIYIVFNSSTTLTNNNFTIYFNVPKATLGNMDPSYVKLFVYENGGWTKLDTFNLTGTNTDPVQFYAITHHFSTYVIGSECPSGQVLSGTSCVTPAPTPAPASSGGGGGGGGGYVAPKNVTNTTNVVAPTPVNVTNETNVVSNLQKYVPPVPSNTAQGNAPAANNNNGNAGNGITGQAIANTTPFISMGTAIWLILGVIILGILAYVFYRKRSR